MQSYGKRSRTYAVPASTFEQAKRLKTEDQYKDYSQLGHSIVGKFLDSNKTYTSTISLFGQDVQVHIGEKAGEVGRLVKSYPQVIGKTKNKGYDISFDLFNTQRAYSIPRETAVSSQTPLMIAVKKFAGDDLAGLKYIQSLNYDTIMQQAQRSCARWVRSQQWYILNQRQILNIKMQMTLYLQGTACVVVDYIDDISDSNLPINDRLIYVKGGKISEELASGDYLRDMSKLTEELKTNVISDDMVDKFKQESAANLQSKITKLTANRYLDKQITAVKIGYLPLIKKLMIFTSEQDVSATVNVKLYYKQSVFEPYHAYMTSTIIPASIFGTTHMFSGLTDFKDSALKQSQPQQQLVLKSSGKKINKLNYALSQAITFKKVYEDQAFAWEYILPDWQDIANSEKDPAILFLKYKNYNKGMLRQFQQLFMSAPIDFIEVIKKVKPLISRFILASPQYSTGLDLGGRNLLKAYNSMQQPGASDVVTLSIVKIMHELLYPNDRNIENPRAARVGNGNKYGGNQGNGGNMGGSYNQNNQFRSSQSSSNNDLPLQQRPRNEMNQEEFKADADMS